MGRKHKPEEHVNHERWLVSYADFITLLFAFFVVMYSISELDKRKMIKVAEAVKFAFGQTGDDKLPFMFVHEEGGPSVMSEREDKNDNTSLVSQEEEEELQGLIDRIKKILSPLSRNNALPEGVELELTSKGILIRLLQVNFFDPGGAMLRPETLPILDAIGGRLALTGRFVTVRGHTDNQNLGLGGRFPSNWDLAAMRSVSVGRYLHEATHVPPARLTVSTLGQYHPIASNDTLKGRIRNRRIDILIEAFRTKINSKSKETPESVPSEVTPTEPAPVPAQTP
jgi:chemotaxis protein MotB